VRVLCCCPPLEGLIHPLLPLALALVDAGHEVRIATGPSAHQRVRSMGLVPVTAGPSQADAALAAAALPGLADLPPTEMWRLATAMFASVIAPAQVQDMEQIVAEWQPDLIVGVPMALAAPLIAAKRRLPMVTQGFGLVPRPQMLQGLAAAVAPLWQSRGLEVPRADDLFGSLYLNPVPQSLEADVAEPRFARSVRMRLETPVPSGACLPAWADQLGARPLIYVGLGTVPPFSQPRLFSTILGGLAEHDVDVVVTVGEHNQVTSVGPLPRHVHVEQWLPLPLILPRCTAAIAHAGSGTTLSALAAGLPLLLLPQGADQFDNAAACARAGVACVLTPESVSSESVASEAAALLSDQRYRRAAERVRAEIRAMLSPADVVPLLNELVGTSVPDDSLMNARAGR
jgi:UDP:flavonoid glycosyltransferase YjiC (YdhE family)